MKRYFLLFACFAIMFSCNDDDGPNNGGKEPVENPDNGGGTGGSNGGGGTTTQTEYTFKNTEVKTVTNFKGYLRDTGTSTNFGLPIVEGYHKFSFSTGAEVSEDSNDWDIAFNSTAIIVNGGEDVDGEPNRTGMGACYLASGTLESVNKVVFANLVAQSVPKWYSYDMNTHVISPLPGKVIVLKTHDGKYAKMVVKSYYKNSDSSEFGNMRYYTFEYVYE